MVMKHSSIFVLSLGILCVLNCQFSFSHKNMNIHEIYGSMGMDLSFVYQKLRNFDVTAGRGRGLGGGEEKQYYAIIVSFVY